MVVFTCNNCGESLQKPKVDKHYQTVCRRAKNLTCVDCFKDFRDEEYAAHTKCITEQERYAAKGSMPNGVVKKGEVKQQLWTEMINGILEKEENNISVSVRNLLRHISGYCNIPRKKAKLLNFIANSWGRKLANQKDIDSVWDLIEKHKVQQFPPKNAENGAGTNGVDKEHKENGDTKVANGNNDASTNGETHKRKAETNNNDSTSEEIPKKKKKSKNKENTGANIEPENGSTNGADVQTEKGDDANDKFSYENKILEVLNTKKQISLKKLQKKVLSAYVKHHGVEEHTEKQVKKFNQRLKKLPNVEIKDDLVLLT